MAQLAKDAASRVVWLLLVESAMNAAAAELGSGQRIDQRASDSRSIQLQSLVLSLTLSRSLLAH